MGLGPPLRRVSLCRAALRRSAGLRRAQAWRVDDVLSFGTSVPLDCASLQRGGLQLVGPDGAPVPGRVSCDGLQVSFHPDQALTATLDYTLHLNAQAVSTGGKGFDAPLQWTFTTQAQWRGPLQVATGDGNQLRAASPRLVPDGQGGAMLVWDQGVGLVARPHAARYSPAAGWTTPENLDPAGDASGLDLASSASGPAVSVWSRFGPAGLDIWADRYQPGTGWSGPGLIEVARTGGASSPRVAMDAQGRAIAVWQQGDGARSNVWGVQMDAQGVWGLPFVLDQFDGDAAAPQLALNAQGAAMVIWTQADPGTGATELWGRGYRPDAGWDDAVRISAAGVSMESATLALESEGAALLAWT
jgi:hypothetical protein